MVISPTHVALRPVRFAACLAFSSHHPRPFQILSSRCIPAPTRRRRHRCRSPLSCAPLPPPLGSAPSQTLAYPPPRLLCAGELPSDRADRRRWGPRTRTWPRRRAVAEASSPRSPRACAAGAPPCTNRSTGESPRRPTYPLPPDPPRALPISSGTMHMLTATSPPFDLMLPRPISAPCCSPRADFRELWNYVLHLSSKLETLAIVVLHDLVLSFDE